MIPTPTQIRILHYLAKQGDRGARPASIGTHLFPRKSSEEAQGLSRGPKNAQGAALAACGHLAKLKAAGLIVRHAHNQNWILSQVGVEWLSKANA